MTKAKAIAALTAWRMRWQNPGETESERVVLRFGIVPIYECVQRLVMAAG